MRSIEGRNKCMGVRSERRRRGRREEGTADVEEMRVEERCQCGGREGMIEVTNEIKMESQREEQTMWNTSRPKRRKGEGNFRLTYAVIRKNTNKNTKTFHPIMIIYTKNKNEIFQTNVERISLNSPELKWLRLELELERFDYDIQLTEIPLPS